MFIGPEPTLDIVFCYNLEVCCLIFDHNTLTDICVWAQASWTQRLL